MRFPSLFRLPSSQQFEIKPRYYDPVKEFVKEREMLAKSAKKHGKDAGVYQPGRIEFQRKQTGMGASTSLLQLIIALTLGSLMVGWLYIGNDILYVGLILAPLYLYFRIRKK